MKNHKTTSRSLILMVNSVRLVEKAAQTPKNNVLMKQNDVYFGRSVFCNY